MMSPTKEGFTKIFSRRRGGRADGVSTGSPEHRSVAGAGSHQGPWMASRVRTTSPTAVYEKQVPDELHNGSTTPPSTATTLPAVDQVGHPGPGSQLPPYTSTEIPQYTVQPSIHTGVPHIEVSHATDNGNRHRPQAHDAGQIYPELGQKDTRLVRIHAADNDHDPIVCTSTAVALHDELVYDALSYTWGPDHPLKSITLNGHHYSVRETLFEALTALRSRKVEFAWIDNLSIDQSSTADKDRQIGRMHIIFSHADRVYAWIGPPGSESVDRKADGIPYGEVGVRLLSRPLPDRPFKQEEINAVQEVVERPYWTRSWIIQELCRSKQAFILCGSSIANFSEFWKHLDEFDRRTEASWIPDTVREHLDSLTRFHTQESSKSRDPQMPLIEALLHSRHSNAKISRDKIYAILNLAHDGTKLVDTPNYRQSNAAIFWKLAHSMIHLQGHVAIILLARREIPQDRLNSRRLSVESRDTTHVGERTSLAPQGRFTHQRHSSLSSQDIQGFNTASRGLPSWTPFWPAFDNPLPVWIIDSVEQHRPRTKPPSTSHDGAVLCTNGVCLETIESTSGIPGTPKYNAPEPNEPRQSPVASEPDIPLELSFSRRQSFARKQFTSASEVLRKVWNALSAPVAAEETGNVPPLHHNCHTFGCLAKDANAEESYAIACVLRDGGPLPGKGREIIRQWMSINKSFRIGPKDLESWIDDILEPKSPLQASEDRRFSKHKQRNTGPSTCEFHEEVSWLSRAFEMMRIHKMRLAVTNKRTVKVVYCEASPGDEICRLDGCPLPVVLRPCSPSPPPTSRSEIPLAAIQPQETQRPPTALQDPQGPAISPPRPPSEGRTMVGQDYQYIGEVYLHNYKSGSFVDPLTGWKDSYFLDDKWTDLRIV